MAEKKLVVSLALKADGYKAQINSINKDTKLLKSNFDNAKAGSENFENSLQGQEAKLKLLSGQLENAKKKVNIYSTEITKCKSTLDEVTKSFTDQEKEVDSLKAQIQDYSNAYGKTSSVVQNLETQLKSAEKSLTNKRKAVISTNNSLTTMQTELNKTQAEMKNLQKEIDGLPLKNLGENLTKVGNGISKVGDGVKNVGSKVSVASAGIVAGMGGAVKVAIDFEKAMSQVQSTSSASAEDIAKLSKNAEDLGKSIKGASATEIAESYNYLALAGYKTEEMLAAMEPTVKANIAFGGDMATTADLMTDSLSALGMGADDAAYYLDVVAQTSRNANTSGTQLMEAYVVAGGTLANLNIPLEESAKILGVMADNGLKGSEAGNSLQSVLVNLMGTTSTTAGALKELNVESYDSEGKFRGLQAVLGDVVKSASQMTDEQADMTLAMLGGKTQLTALNNMLKAADGSYDSLEKSIGNSSGALEEMYQVMSDNTSGTWAETQSKIEATSKTFGDMLLPIVDIVITKIGNLADWLGGLSSGTQTIILAVGGFIAILGPLLIIIGTLISSIGTIVTAFGALSTAIGGAGGIATLFGSTLLPVISIIGGLIAIVVTLAMSIKENWEGIKEATNNLIETCKPFFDTLKESFKNLWESCKDIYDTVIQPLFRIMGEIIEECIHFVIPLFQQFMIIFSAIFDAITIVWNNIGKPIFSSIVSVIEIMWAIIQPILRLFSGLFSGVMNIVSSAWNGIGKPAFNAITTVVGAMWKGVSAILNSFKSLVQSVFGFIGDKISWLVDKFKWLTNAISGIGGKIGSVISGIFGGGARSIDFNPGEVALSGSYYNADTDKSEMARASTENRDLSLSDILNTNNSTSNNIISILTKVLQQNNINLINAIANIQISNADVYLDNKLVGRSVAGVVDRQIGKINRKEW